MTPPPAKDPTAATIYTDITIIVIKPELQAKAEAAAIAADPAGGAGTFVPGVPLRRAGDPTNTVAAYWCRWNMIPGQRSAFASSIGGPMNILSAGATVPTNRDRWMFDARDGQWAPDQVLAALGLDVPDADADL